MGARPNPKDHRRPTGESGNDFLTSDEWCHLSDNWVFFEAEVNKFGESL